MRALEAAGVTEEGQGGISAKSFRRRVSASICSVDMRQPEALLPLAPKAFKAKTASRNQSPSMELTTVSSAEPTGSGRRSEELVAPSCDGAMQSDRAGLPDGAMRQKRLEPGSAPADCQRKARLLSGGATALLLARASRGCKKFSFLPTFAPLLEY